jgi:hypothetical protein
MADLPEDEKERRLIIEEKLELLLETYVTIQLSAHQLTEAIKFHVAEFVVESCLAASMTDYLFHRMFDKFVDYEAHGPMVDALAVYIVKGKIDAIPAPISRALLDRFYANPQHLERCVIRLDLSTFDLDRMLAYFAKYQCWGGILYIWSTAMQDWTSPLVEMIPLVRFVIDRPYHRLSKRAKLVFPFMRMTLCGLSFPFKKPLDIIVARTARTAVYQFLFSRRNIRWPADGKIVLTADASMADDDYPFPYLRLFIQLDARKFVSVMEHAFEDDFLDAAAITLENPGAWRSGITRQAMVNSLLELVPPNITKSLTPQHVIVVCCFIARCTHKYNKHVVLEPDVAKLILNLLTLSKDASTYDERQKAVEELLFVHSPEKDEHVIKMFESAGFYRVLETIYRSERNFGKVVETYLHDPSRRHLVFDCVRKLLSEKSKSVEKGRLLEKKRDQVLASVWALLGEIVEVDGYRAAQLVKDSFNNRHEDVIVKLSNAPNREYAYLRGLLDAPKTSRRNYFVADKSLVVSHKLMERYISLMCERNPKRIQPFLEKNVGRYRLEEAIAICQVFTVIDALVWLYEYKDDQSRALDVVITNINQQADIICALATQVRSHGYDPTDQEKTALKSSSDKLVELLKMGVGVCERASIQAHAAISPEARKALDYESQDLWFSLLSAFVDTIRQLKFLEIAPPAVLNRKDGHMRAEPAVSYIIALLRSNLRGALTNLLHVVGTTSISLPQLLLRVIQSQPDAKLEPQSVHANQRNQRICTFSDIRDIFFGAMDLYHFEQQLVNVATKIVAMDVYQEMRSSVRLRARGTRLGSAECCICKQKLWVNPSMLKAHKKHFHSTRGKEPEHNETHDSLDTYIFHCGHGYHVHCWPTSTTKTCIECAQTSSAKGWFHSTHTMKQKQVQEN